MGFDLTFLKPDGQGNVPNRVWAEKILGAFPGFSEVECDYEALAQRHAGDIGLSVSEYVARGIGIELHAAESDGWWLVLGFGDFCVTLKSPNFPTRSIAEAISTTSQIRTFLRDTGFILFDDHSGEPVERDNEERVIFQAYQERQRVVSRVAILAGGRVPGVNPK